MQLDETIPFLVRLQMHRNPFEHDRDGVLAIARKATLTTRGEFVYSNLGTALLGHALTSMAHRDYVTLVQQRLLIPLGMSATTLPLTAKDLRTDAPTGYSADGAGEAPWTVNGWGLLAARARRQRTWHALRGRSSTALRRAWTR